MIITPIGSSFKQTYIVSKEKDENDMCYAAYIWLWLYLGLLADLTKRTPNINIANISKVKRYRNLITTSIDRSHSTIASFLYIRLICSIK